MDNEMTKGRFTYGNPIRMGNGNNVTIGQFCSIADGVVIDSGFNHSVDFISTFPFHVFPEHNSLPSNIKIKGHVKIGDDVWLASGCCVMSGVTIGCGAVIGMRAIISKDVPPYAVVVGAPQKIIKYRFSPEQIEKLLIIKWWDWELPKIMENAHLLQSDNIDEFLRIHG